MIHKVEVTCPHCQGNDMVKNGHRTSGVQRWRCNVCKKSFQLDYTYNAYLPGIKEQIVEHALNASGVRDTARVLKIAKGTVIGTLKKNKSHTEMSIS